MEKQKESIAKDLLRKTRLGLRHQVGPLDIWQLQNEYFLQPSINEVFLLKDGMVKLSELEEPEVQRIAVANETNQQILVFEGLIFDGLRQARMAASDQILEPAAEGFLDVVCIEQGYLNELRQKAN